MKTAMQLFLEWYNDYVKDNGTPPSNYDINFFIKSDFLLVEKEQIINAFDEGAHDGTPMMGDEYFKDVFKNVSK